MTTPRPELNPNSTNENHHSRLPKWLLPVVGGVALTGVLIGGIAADIAGFGRHDLRREPAPNKNRITLVNEYTLSQAQLEKSFTLRRSVAAPDGHSVFVVGVDKQNPSDAELFVSTNNGTTYQQVAENVDIHKDDVTYQPAVWSPYVVNGQDPLLAVLHNNVENHPDANGDTLPDYLTLYEVTPQSVRVAADTETDANSLTFDYAAFDKSGKSGMADMYSWQKQGNTVTFGLSEPIGGMNPDGTYWVGSEQVAQLQAKVPPQNNQW